MTIATTCSCGKKYQVKEELAGKRVKCPACGQSFSVAKVESVISPLDDSVDNPPADTRFQRRANKSAASFRTVRLGVSLVYLGLLLLLLVLVLAVLALLLPFFGGSLRMLFILAITLPMVRIVATAMGLAGKVLCLAVPEETGSKQIIFAAVILDVVAVLVSLAEFVVEVPGIVGLLAQLLSVTALVLFLVFLRQLALHLKEPAVAEQAANVLRVGVGMIITFVLAIVGVVVFPPLALMMLVTIILGLVGLILYARLLTGIKRSLVQVI